MKRKTNQTILVSGEFDVGKTATSHHQS